MFEWNPNIAEIWDQFLKVVEGHEDRDLRIFNQGPWCLRVGKLRAVQHRSQNGSFAWSSWCCTCTLSVRFMVLQ